ncbi:MAG: tRNA (uridine(34)/cytosine(34)/5-carboxymethylaminomethyluridine(34)-2'-O)-methyltransferase TrmL [Sulfuricellaceae bacterium]
MFDVILHQPEIPPNTGNIIRLCANTGAGLHLVKPLGFTLEDKQLRRAGLDYHEYAALKVHEDWETCLTHFAGRRLFALTTKGATRHSDIAYRPGDAFLFGAETRGLPPGMLETFPTDRRLRIPMRPDNRSLNLSNAAAVIVFEAWRQMGFAGAG